MKIGQMSPNFCFYCILGYFFTKSGLKISRLLQQPNHTVTKKSPDLKGLNDSPDLNPFLKCCASQCLFLKFFSQGTWLLCVALCVCSSVRLSVRHKVNNKLKCSNILLSSTYTVYQLLTLLTKYSSVHGIGPGLVPRV